MVIVGAFQGPPGSAQSILDANREFEFDAQPDSNTWAGINPPDDLSGPCFGFRWDQTPKNGRSFILGALDADIGDKSKCACDFQLAENNQTGVSRKQLSIDIYRQNDAGKDAVVRLSCLNGQVKIAATSGTRAPEFLERGCHMPVTDPIAIGVAGLRFRLWIPTLTADESKERNRLAHQFELDRFKNPPAHLPSIDAGVNTQYDNIRTTEKGGCWMYVGKNHPSSTEEKPFFNVWRAPNHLSSAWQPRLGRDDPREIVDLEVAKVQTYCDISKVLRKHPNVYQFKEVGVYRARDFEARIDILPWAIGEHVAETTVTLATYLGRPGDEFAAHSLLIFQQICSAVSHAHSYGVTHGQLSPKRVLVKARDDTIEAKVFGFEVSGRVDEELETAVQHDNLDLGLLGVRLLAVSHQNELPRNPSSHIELKEWVAKADQSDPRFRPLLTGLLQGTFSAENAMHHSSGILLYKDATRAIAEGLENRKRKIAPTKPSVGTNPDLQRRAPRSKVRFAEALTASGSNTITRADSTCSRPVARSRYGGVTRRNGTGSVIKSSNKFASDPALAPPKPQSGGEGDRGAEGGTLATAQPIGDEIVDKGKETQVEKDPPQSEKEDSQSHEKEESEGVK